ncbi:MAG: 23S rRNA (adenine(2503)-C(2))-methyltransferase RlmN [Kiritimatiellia bacterium]
MSHNILEISLPELEDRFEQMNEARYRARQVFSWIYEKNAVDYEGMTSLPGGLREKLAVEFPFPVLDGTERRNSADGTVKFGWSMSDGERVESAFIPMREHNTLCISSQAGCARACIFCASGTGGLKRNLGCGEITAQVLHTQRELDTRISHIVFMGVGEPFDNYDKVLGAARMLNAENAFNIAARRITISTCGVVPGIEKLSKEGRQFELSVSLHAPDNEIRGRLMPVNRQYPLEVLIPACRDYAEATNRQVTFEYVLADGLNDTKAAAGRLADLLGGWLCKVNLIPVNPVVEAGLKPPERERAKTFQGLLKRGGVHTTLRAPRGQDISAACGQLRHGTG